MSHLEGTGCDNAYEHDLRIAGQEGAREALRRVWGAMVSPHAIGMDIEATKNACFQVERVAAEMGVQL